MNLKSLLQVLAVVAVALRDVEGNSGCDSALVKAVDCKERAVATHESELAEPLAKRNCRFINSINTCRDELKAVCPSMMRFWTTMNLDVLNKFQGTNWDTEKCPRTMYDEQPEPKAKEEEVESETEKDDDKMTGNKSEKDDDKMTGNKSGQIKQTPLFVFVLLAGALVILLA